ncbi:MAG: hypothetical protein K6G94_02760 [Kiritimatiellae bacterium]|nr:hypothetical protein [Kiritimatiellia bacterium]
MGRSRHGIRDAGFLRKFVYVALLLVADIGLAGQWSEDWLEAATESRRRERPIVAAFGDVDPTFADGLASALSNDYVLARVEKPLEYNVAMWLANPFVQRRESLFKRWDVGLESSAVLLIGKENRVLVRLSPGNGWRVEDGDKYLRLFRGMEERARIHDDVIRPSVHRIRRICADFEKSVRNDSPDRAEFLELSTNTLERVRDIRKRMRELVPTEYKDLGYKRARADAKSRLTALRQMTNAVCSIPPSEYKIPSVPDDWRGSKWRGIYDIDDWVAYVNENPQLPKFADFRRNKMLPFLRRELQIVDRAESDEFVRYVLDELSHGLNRSAFCANRPVLGLAQEARRLESLGDTQPLVRLFSAMDWSETPWSNVVARLSALEEEWAGRPEFALMSAIACYYRNAPQGGEEEHVRKVDAAQSKFVEWASGIGDDEVRQAFLVLVVFFLEDIEGFGDKLLASKAPPWLGRMFRGRKKFCRAYILSGYTSKPNLLKESEELRAQSLEDLETALSLHPEIPESAYYLGEWHQFLGSWEKRDEYFDMALQREFDNERVWRAFSDYDMDRQWGGTHRDNEAFGRAMSACTRYDTQLPTYFYFGVASGFGASLFDSDTKGNRLEWMEDRDLLISQVEMLKRIAQLEDASIVRRSVCRRKLLELLLVDGRYEEFRDTARRFGEMLEWRLCGPSMGSVITAEFDELQEVFLSPRSDTYIALHRLCREDRPKEFFEAFNRLRWDLSPEIPRNERCFCYKRCAWMSRRFVPRVESDLYRHYVPHARWTNASWTNSNERVVKVPPTWEEFRIRKYVPFLERLKGIGMLADPVLYFGASDETAGGWFPVEERTDRECEDIANWICQQDLSSDDDLRCAYILARRAFAGEAKEHAMELLEKGGVDRWLLLMLRGGAMNQLAACGLRPMIPESWCDAGIVPQTWDRREYLLGQSQILSLEGDSLCVSGVPRLRSWYVGSPYNRRIRSYDKLARHCFGDASVTNVTLSQLIEKQRTNTTETARRDYSKEAIDAFEALVGDRSPYSIVEYLEGSRAPTARWRTAMGMFARRYASDPRGGEKIGELKNSLDRQIVATWFVDRLMVDVDPDGHHLSIHSAEFLPDDAASHVGLADGMMRRLAGDRMQFFAANIAPADLVTGACRHLIAALYTEPDNAEAVRLATVYGFKYPEFAELSNAISEFPLSRPIWEKVHAAESERLAEIARREAAERAAKEESKRKAEQEKRDKEQAKIDAFRASKAYRYARRLPGNTLAESGLWHDYIAGEGKAYADNETFKREVFIPFFVREFGIDANDPHYGDMMALLEKEFADPLCWTGDCEAWLDRRLFDNPTLSGRDRVGGIAMELFKAGCTNSFVVASAYSYHVISHPPFAEVNGWRITDDRRDDAARFMTVGGLLHAAYNRDRSEEIAEERRKAFLTWVRHLDAEGTNLAQWRTVEMFVLRICGRHGFRKDLPSGVELTVPRPNRDLAEMLEKEGVALPLAKLLREDPVFR